MKKIELKVKLLRGSSAIPEYALPGDAGLDLRADIDTTATLVPDRVMKIRTGVAVEIPDGYAGLLLPRSGLATRYGITIANSPGLIDSGYRGEIEAALVNVTRTNYDLSPGTRIAQLVLVPVVQARVTSVQELSDSDRGENGFGSTGVE